MDLSLEKDQSPVCCRHALRGSETAERAVGKRPLLSQDLATQYSLID